MNRIDRFVNSYSFLNNFHPSTIFVNGKSYQTVEHAYQAHKASSTSEHEIIRCAADPMEAKRLGKAVILPADWDKKRVELMRLLVRKKFENPLLREMLRATGDAELIHDNRFNDRFWGVCRGSGENWLGCILEETRQEIFDEEKEYGAPTP